MSSIMRILGFGLLVYGIFYSCKNPSLTQQQAPNFLFCIADDWSFPHAGVYGDKVARTPHFDRIAREGALFMNAFTAAPSCAPSRAAVLTGQDIYRLEAGGNLFGTLPQKFPTYTALLAAQGFHIGSTGKGYGPTDLSIEGWTENPAGKEYQDIEMLAPKGMRATDYAGNFEAFLNEQEDDRSFCFWYGASEPHRVYDYGLGAKSGYNLEDIKVPGFLPDVEETRNDVADYYNELEWFDMHLGKMIATLEERGILENTVIIVTSDNGMPFPRAKSTLYNYGVHMPLAIRWGKHIKANSKIDAPVSLIDIAPTILDVLGMEIPEQMTGKSLLPLFQNKTSTEEDRPFVVTAMERHTIARPNNEGYPMRGIHTKEYTYIYNFESDRWPGGNPDVDAWPQGFYGDVDDGASKTYFENNPAAYPYLFRLSFSKRPFEELYIHGSDPFRMDNKANDPAYSKIKEKMKSQLFNYLDQTDDPRQKGVALWDSYPFTGGDEWQK